MESMYNYIEMESKKKKKTFCKVTYNEAVQI